MQNLFSAVRKTVLQAKRPTNTVALNTEWSWEKYRQRSYSSRRTNLLFFKYLWNNLYDWCNWRFNTRTLLKFVLCRFPIIEMIVTYKPHYFFNDIMAGITLSFLHLAQGLAYGNLAGLKGANGIYVSLYAPLIYAVFGTSRHISIGTFAAMALLVEQSTQAVMLKLPTEMLNTTEEYIIREQIAETLSFCTGIVLIIFAILHVGSLVVLIPKAFLRGYICAAALFVFTRQMSSCFDINVPHSSGFGLFFKRWLDIFKNMKNANLVSLGITFLCIGVLWIGKKINQHFKKYVRISLPLEVLCIIIACVIGSKTDIFQRNNVSFIGNLPKGLDYPELPHLSYARFMFKEVFSMVFLTMADNLASIINLSEQCNYEISTHQDLLAYGLTDIICSFFRCYPACVAMSRTLIARANFQHTQFASIVSSLMLVIAVYTITPYLSTLPNAVLAGFVIYNVMIPIKSIVLLKYYWEVDIAEGFMWLASFWSVLLFDLDKGLIVSFIVSTLANTALLMRPTIKTLGRLPDGDFIDNINNPEAKELYDLKIVKMEGPLLSYNASYFKQCILSNLGFEKSHICPGVSKLLESIFKPLNEPAVTSDSSVNTLLVDCSAVTRIDSVGIQILNEIKYILKSNGTELKFVGVKEAVCASIDAEGSYNKLLHGQMFHTINDAVKILECNSSYLDV